MATVNIRKQLREEADVASEFIATEERAAQPGAAFTRLRRSAASLENLVEARGQSLSSSFRLQCVQQSSLFRGLAAAQCSEVAALARGAALRSKAGHLPRGRSGRFGFSVLASGRVKVTQLSRSGAEVILRIKGNGEVIAGLAFNLEYPIVSPHKLSILARCSFGMCEDSRCLNRMPALRRDTVRIFADRLRVLEQRFLELATEQVAPRLARMLVRLIEQSASAHQPGVRISLSREELAQMTGTTLFTVSRLLCEWEQRGIIQTQRKAVVVQNTQRLMALAEGFQSLM